MNQKNIIVGLVALVGGIFLVFSFNGRHWGGGMMGASDDDMFEEMEEPMGSDGVGDGVPNNDGDDSLFDEMLEHMGGDTKDEGVVDDKVDSVPDVDQGNTGGTIEVDNDTTGILPFDSGVSGQVLLGPVCPVMRMPPEAGCADRGYATTVQVIEENSTKSSLFASVETDKEGNYQIMLPPGKYRLQALGGQPFPSCSWAEITIEPNKLLILDLSCDTGIR